MIAEIIEINIFHHGYILYALNEGEDITAYYYEEGSDDEDSEAMIDRSIELGSITLDDGWLEHVEVKAEYQRYGIGTHLVKLAIQHLGLSQIACVTENKAYRFSLTPAGENLIARCIKNSIISPEICVFSNETDEILDNGEDDPGYDSFVVGMALVSNNNEWHSSEEDNNTLNYEDYEEEDENERDEGGYNEEEDEFETQRERQVEFEQSLPHEELRRYFLNFSIAEGNKPTAHSASIEEEITLLEEEERLLDYPQI